MPEHVQAAAALEHPFAVEDAALAADADAAVEWLTQSLCVHGALYVRNARSELVALLRKIKRDLVPVNAVLERLKPRHIAAMPQKVDAALLHVLAQACQSPDLDIAIGFVLGFPAVGDIPPSHWWESKADPATVDLSSLDNEQWRSRAEGNARAAARGDEFVLWERTIAECDEAWPMMQGPFTAADLDERFGRGVWRCMVRFGVLQKGKVRPCDNARASLHNDGTTTHESLVCDSPDFSARAAIRFQAAAERLHRPMWALAGGTDDLADAYRHVPCSQPEYTVVVIIDPVSRQPAYFTMGGFNFGLKSAVLQFNRFPEVMVAVARRLLAIVCTHFYDDYCVVEPTETAAHAQQMLAELHDLVGFPFKEAKHEKAAPKFVFLGVESDLSGAVDGTVTLSVRPERLDSIIECMQQLLDEGRYPPSVAASLCGKLQFTLSWVGGKVGRACMQPLFSPESDCLSPAAADSLRYLIAVLPHLPPHGVSLRPDSTPPALVFSDGAYEEDQSVVAAIGFLVAIPRPDAPPRDPCSPPPRASELSDYYEFYHGAAEVPADLHHALIERKQQIGQVEIIGAIAPYLSVPQLAGRRVIHWIDNQSAEAALCKGYSRVVDSARLVHMFHAWAAAAQASVWFEFVPTDQNVADDPSRDMSLALLPFRPFPGVASSPVRVTFPPLGSLASPGGWAREARAVRP